MLKLKDKIYLFFLQIKNTERLNKLLQFQH